MENIGADLAVMKAVPLAVAHVEPVRGGPGCRGPDTLEIAEPEEPAQQVRELALHPRSGRPVVRQPRRVALAAQGFLDRPHAVPTMRTLQRTLDAVNASGLQHNELWSYEIANGTLRPIRYGASTDVQLWNVTDLAVQFVLSRLPGSPR